MLKILQNKTEIEQARSSLREKGLDTSIGIKRNIFKTLFFIRFRRPAPPVSINKSWDVLTIFENINKFYQKRDISIFEMGSFNSEIPLVLWEAGYRNIRAADLNPLGRCINWYINKIQYVLEDFYTPNIPSESLDVMTCLSVIEHGYDQKKFLGMCKKYLKKGGCIFLTTDYHEEKIHIPEEFKIFDLSYRVFSKTEICSIIEEAKDFGLIPLEKIEWSQSDYPIEFLNHKMTFLLLALKKV